MLAALFVLAGIALLVVAGVGFSRKHFQPQWLGFACIAFGLYMPLLAILTRTH